MTEGNKSSLAKVIGVRYELIRYFLTYSNRSDYCPKKAAEKAYDFIEAFTQTKVRYSDCELPKERLLQLDGALTRLIEKLAGTLAFELLIQAAEIAKCKNKLAQTLDAVQSTTTPNLYLVN